MLLHRVLTALVGAPVVLFAIWFGPPWLTVLAAAAAVLGVREAYRLYPPTGPVAEEDSAPSTPLPILLGGTWAVALVLAGELAVRPRDFAWAAAAICAVGVMIGFLWMIAAWRGMRPLASVAYLVTPPVYIGGALACAVALRGVAGDRIRLPLGGAANIPNFSLPPAIEENGANEPLELWSQAPTDVSGAWLLPDIAGIEFAQSVADLTEVGCWWLLLAILTVYAADTGAYAVGRLIGRHRMAPNVSPGKTWEGTIGGLAAAIVAVVVLGILFPLQVEIWQLALIGVILGTVSPAGDLLESKLKRLANAKDSGTLFPGHGGMLDRLDSLLPSVAIVYIFATAIPVAN